MATRWSLHVKEWSNCKKCYYGETRDKIVLGKGETPCDVVFVGQGPGKSENKRGLPFDGPAGHLLDGIIAEALPEGVTFAITNLVACFPIDKDGVKDVEPDPECIKACSPRLKDFVDMSGARLLVALGRWADTYTSPWMKHATKFDPPIPRVCVVHPSFILQARTVNQGSMRRQCVIAIRDAVKKFVLNPVSPEAVVGQWDGENCPF